MRIHKRAPPAKQDVEEPKFKKQRISLESYLYPSVSDANPIATMPPGPSSEQLNDITDALDDTVSVSSQSTIIDISAIQANLSKHENDLFAVDGPPHTWNLKKSLTSRVRMLSEKIDRMRPTQPSATLNMQSTVLLPFHARDGRKGAKVCFTRACEDDSDPPRPIAKNTYATISEIDAGGDYKVQLEVQPHSVRIVRERTSLLQSCVSMCDPIDHIGAFEQDMLTWRIEVDKA